MRPSPILALCALALLGAAPIPGLPPLNPAGETPITPTRTPHADCIATALQALAATHGRLERALVTRSRRWGEVWRADFESSDGPPPLINRVVCWRGDMQIAVAQDLPPLPAPATASHPTGVRCAYTPVENPCRQDPVEILWLCVRPSLVLYADGASAPADGAHGLGVSPIERTPLESDAAWAARCATRGGMLRPEDLP